MVESVRSSNDQPQPRRGFLQFITVIISGLAALLPAVAGLPVLLDPLRKRNGKNGLVKVTSLAHIPDDGVPRQFPVIANQKDAWTFFPNQRIGSIFLRRAPGEQTPQCFTSTCPHLGCSVSFVAQTNTYDCPCHNSKFDVDGGRIDPTPSPRNMDPLDVEVNENGDVLVRYTSFYSGKDEREEKS